MKIDQLKVGKGSLLPPIHWLQIVSWIHASTPKAFANSSLGQRPKERRTIEDVNAESVREYCANAFGVQIRLEPHFPGALLQAGIRKRLRRNQTSNLT